MSEEQDPVSQRINFLIEQFDSGVRSRFASRIGMSAGMISDLFGKRKNKPGLEMLQKIAESFPQLRMRWLLTGEGEMLKSEESQNISSQTGQGLAPPGAGENSISPHFRRGDYGPALPLVAEDAPPYQSRPAGLDLVEKVAQHEADITQLRQQFAQLQAQLQKQSKK